MKDVLAAALLTALIAGGAQAEEPSKKEQVELKETPSGAAFVELMAGYPTSTAEVTAFAYLTGRLYLTVRGRTTIQYENGTTPSVDPFVLGSASFNVVDGLGLRLETYYAAEELRPSFGLEYLKEVGPLNVLGIANIGLPNLDGEFVFIGSYAPQLKDHLSLYLGLELVTNIGKEGHNFSQQRPRLGLCIDNLCFGAGANFEEVGNDGNFSYSVGGFGLGIF